MSKSELQEGTTTTTTTTNSTSNNRNGNNNTNNTSTHTCTWHCLVAAMNLRQIFWALGYVSLVSSDLHTWNRSWIHAICNAPNVLCKNGTVRFIITMPFAILHLELHLLQWFPMTRFAFPISNGSVFRMITTALDEKRDVFHLITYDSDKWHVAINVVLISDYII